MAENIAVDKRKCPRLNIVCPCIVRAGSRELHAIIRNISCKGLSIEISNLLAENTAYTVAFVLPDGPHIKTTGKIHWSMPQGSTYIYGLEFNSLGFFKKMSVNSYIKKGLARNNKSGTIK